MTDRELMQQACEMLKRAKDAVADWGAYASEYFQHKHNLQGDIDDIQAQITALSERLAQEPVATPSRSFEDVYKVQTERLATERERADKAEQNYRLMIKNHVPRNIFDWNRRK